MKSYRVKTLVMFTFIIDVIVLFISLFIGLLVESVVIKSRISIDQSLVPYVVITSFIILSLMFAYEMYGNIFYRTKSDIIATLALIVTISGIINVIVMNLIGPFYVNIHIVFYTSVAQWFLISIWRIIVLALRRNTCISQKIMIVANYQEAEMIAKKFLMNLEYLFEIKYIYIIGKESSDITNLIISVDHVLIGSDISNKLSKEIAYICMKYNKNVFTIPEIYSINVKSAKLIHVGDLPLFNLRRFGLTIDQMIIKRILDISISLTVLIFTLPILIIASVAIKLESKGPILFSQERITMNNKPFKIIKFRTMVVDAENITGPILACEDDPRITRVGRFMRSTRIDEIPQLLNVVTGKMSIVGPRPERQFFIDQFVEQTPEFKYRTNVKAGVTGLAQVLGKYTTSPEDKLRYDLIYIKNYNLLMDFRILLKTLRVILNRDASEGVGVAMDFKEFLISKNRQLRTTEYGYEILNANSLQTKVDKKIKDQYAQYKA